MTAEFGGRAGSLLADLALPSLGGLTASEALTEGLAVREIWLALCAETDVPPERRYGVGRREPKR